MEQRDVAIIGGGPAGSACAWRLRQAGMSAVVYDKQPFPRDKVCAGWITPPVVETLQLDLADYRRGRVLQPFRGFRIGQIGRAPAQMRYETVVSYGIRRCEFDEYLLRRSGADLRLYEPLQSLERDSDGWIVNGAMRAAVVVGAGGHFCPVARRLGNSPGRLECVVAAQEAEFRLSGLQSRVCPIEPEVPELYFCRDLKGYGWCIRKGDYLNVGLGREDNHRLGEHVAEFAEWLQWERRIPSPLTDRFKGHAYLLYAHTPRRVVGDGVMLIGDAAGLAYPRSGEGIGPAIESGLMAADVIAGTADYSAEALAAYERRLVSRFGVRSEAFQRHILPSGVRAWIGRRLLSTSWFARHVVLERWFLHQGLATRSA